MADSEKPELEFYDVKTKSKFKSTEWEVRSRDVKGNPRFFAVCKSPNGPHECWRVVGKDFAEQHK